MTRRVRETSKRAYEQILAEGLLSTARLNVYRELYRHGPMTASELEEHTGRRRHEHKRLSELRDLGVVREVGTRKCKVTGREAIEWDVTPHLPSGWVHKTKPQEVVVVSNCSECLMRDTDNTCMGADEGQVVGCCRSGRPADCPLNRKSYVIRSA